ncbi:MAG: PEGA domain-containing protein [bacterium]
MARGGRQALAAVALAVGLGGGALPGGARANEAARARVPVVVLGAHPWTQADAIEALWAARGVIDAHPELVSVDLAQQLGGGRARDEAAMRALIEAGVEAYDQADMGEAEKHLSIAALIGSGQAVTLPLAVEALSTLARLRAAQQDEKGAVQAFVRLLRLMPGFTLDPAQAAPSAARRLAKAQAIIDEAAASRLRVAAEPVAAAVFVDGRLRGVTPLYLASVPAGTHHLRIAADGYRDDLGLVELRAGRETPVQATLPAAEKAALFDQIVAALPDDVEHGDAQAGLGDLKALTGAEQAVVLSATQAGWLHGALFELRSLRRVRAVKVPLTPDATEAGQAVIRELYRGLDARRPAQVPAAAVAAVAEPEPEGGSRWWLWTSIAVGVAAAVTVPLVIWALDDDEGGVPRAPGTGAVIIRY